MLTKSNQAETMNVPPNIRLLIDGYNLIFCCGLQGKHRSPTALQRARDRLVSSLDLHLPDAMKSRTVVVFDASKLPIREDVSTHFHNQIRIEYATTFDDADSMIEFLIRKNSNPKSLTVVSSDHRIHKAAETRKAKPVDSEIWFEKLESSQLLKSQTKNDRDDSKTEKEIPNEIEAIDWAAKFEDELE
ncbi:MAG: NYN domain-containing protein [Planctomycetota bacterium]